MRKTILLCCSAFIILSCSNIRHIVNPAGFSGRHGHSSAVLDDNLIVISGSERLDYLDYLYGDLKKDILISGDDGDSWQPVVSIPFKMVGSAALTYNNKIYVIGGMYSINGSTDWQFEQFLWSSSDGINWTPVGGLPDSYARRDFAFVTYNNKYWILGGNKGAADLALPYGSTNIVQSNEVLFSADGSSFTEAGSGSSTGRWSPRDGLAAVSFQNKLWIFGGAKRYANRNGAGFEYESIGDAWNTEDGITWTPVAQKGDATRWEAKGRAFHRVVVLNGSLYLIGGIEANLKNRIKRPCNDIQYSNDGISWRKVAEFPGPRYDFTAVVKDNSIYIIGGRNASAVLNDIIIYTP